MKQWLKCLIYGHKWKGAIRGNNTRHNFGRECVKCGKWQWKTIPAFDYVELHRPRPRRVEIVTTTETIINGIEEARARNNKHWMAILQLAFRAKPDEAAEIMSRITDEDAEINRLCRQLVKEGGQKK